MVRCPKCRQTLRVPQTVPPEGGVSDNVWFQTEDDEQTSLPSEPASHWQPRENAMTPPQRRASTWKWLLLLAVFLAPIAVVGVLVALPYLVPKDPRELVAKQYLEAVRRADFVEAGKLSVIVSEHPRNITRVGPVGLAEPWNEPTRGKFAGLRQFHSDIAQKYNYNEARGRFDLKDPLGAGMDVLANLEQVKKKADEQASASPTKKYRNPEEKLLDDALNVYSAFGELAKGASGLLSSGTLGPTYEDLLTKTAVPLSDSERALAEHFMRDPDKWQRLLGGRSFLDLPDLGAFELYDVEMAATIRTEGQSLGEPGRPIKLRLVRFVMGSIDTGWRVWHAE
jgi:hypothetical protein